MEHFLPVCSFLSDFSLTSFGPNGASKLVHPNPRSKKVSFSTKASFLYQSDRFTLGKPSQSDNGDDSDQSINQSVNRAINGMLRVFFSTLTANSDGGHLFVIIATNLLLQCSYQSFSSSIYPSSHPFCHFPCQVISTCQQRLINKCCDFLSSQSVLVSLNRNWQIILKAIESQFKAKPILNYLTSHESTHASRIAALIFQSYLYVFNQSSSSAEMLTRIRLHTEIAAPAYISFDQSNDQSDEQSPDDDCHSENECTLELMNGVLVDVALPLVFRSVNKSINVIRDLTVVVYDVSLAFTDEESRGGLSGPSIEGDEHNLIAARNQLIDRLINKWTSMNVKAVFCQKVIHATMKHRLSQHGILFLERLSIRHIAAVQSVVQCKLVSGLNPDLVTQDHVGFVGMIKEFRLNTRSYLFVGDCDDTSRKERARCGICTLVITHPDHNYLAELERCVKSAVSSFVTSIQHDANEQMCVAVCHGGGHIERVLSYHCNELAKASKERHETFMSRASTSNSRVLTHKLYSAARLQMLEVMMLEDFARIFQSIAHCLVDADDDDEPSLVANTPEQWDVIDLTVIKRRSLMNAVETAGMLMRVSRELSAALPPS